MYVNQSILAFFLLSLLFSFCKNDKKATLDLNATTNVNEPIAFETQTFEAKSKSCLTNPNENCAQLKLQYVVATGQNTAAKIKINAKISAFLAGLIVMEDSPAKDTFSLGQLGDVFLADFEKNLKENADLKHNWEIEGNVEVIHETDNRFCLEMRYYSFLGGAHPNAGTLVQTIDKATGEALKLEDVFKTTDGLSALLEAKVRESLGIPEGEPLAQHGFLYETKTFPLTDNFAVLKEGIRFVYPPYDIAAYAVGQIDVTIPMQDIDPILK